MANRKRSRIWATVTLLAFFVTIAFGLAPLDAQEKYDNFQRERAVQMARDVADAMRKHYYDPRFHGIDMEARFKAAEENIRKAEHLGQAYTAIAAALQPLNDSHTIFLPPARPARFQYGYILRIVGDRCFVTNVRPKTDAASKLKPGEEVLAVEGFRPTRESLRVMDYYFNRLSPRAVMHLDLRGLDGNESRAEVATKARQEKLVLDVTAAGGGQDIWQLIREEETTEHLLRQRYYEYGDALMIWKMPEFDLDEGKVEDMFGKARKHQALILDLRGNPGGSVKTLEYAVGNVMDHDVTIAKRVGRKENLKPQLGKTRGSHAYAGKLIVLVDSYSASAAELFARVVQLEHRGIVLGDRSSGNVMESRYYPFSQGADTKIFYGAAITDADLIMSDGKSLEHNGVVPDEMLLPTAEDLAAGRDPVLSHAAELAGVKLDPQEAGKLFPFEWQPE